MFAPASKCATDRERTVRVVCVAPPTVAADVTEDKRKMAKVRKRPPRVVGRLASPPAELSEEIRGALCYSEQ